MPDVRNVEFRAQLEVGKFPFADTATLTNSAGDFIPETLFLDGALHPVGAVAGMFIPLIRVSGDTVTIFIGDENNLFLASAEFNTIDPPDVLSFVDALGRHAGILVSEASRLTFFQGWSSGDHEFFQPATMLASRVCLPLPEIGFRGFILDDGSVLTGDIWLVGDRGIVIRSSPIEINGAGPAADAEQGHAIRIDIVGDPLFRRRLCGDLFESPQFLQRITFHRGCDIVQSEGDDYGDVRIMVGKRQADDTILRIVPGDKGLLFETVGEPLGTGSA